MIILLKKAVKKKIISPIDFDFAKFIAKKNNIIMLVAACISYENRKGYIFLPIEYFEKKYFFSNANKLLIKKILLILGNIENWETELLQHSSFSNGLATTPLVLNQKKIYLYKMWQAKKNILNHFILCNTKNKANKRKCFNILNNLFPEKKIDFQKVATANTLLNNIVFIIGGPGTGKTTTILKIIIALIKNSKKIIKIQLSAPTGKATTRLSDIIRNDVFDIYLTQQEKASLPSSPKTIHQLLAIQELSQKSIFNDKNLLDLDVLIIDEVSMIDFLMMEKILCAVSKKTKLIFIGDHNQLCPIESGSVLKYIYYCINYLYNSKNMFNIEKIIGYPLSKKINKKTETLISNNIIVLKKNYRFNKNSGIHKLSDAIIHQKINIIHKSYNNKLNNVFFYEINSMIKYQKMIEKLSLQYSLFWKAINAKHNIKTIIEYFQNHQILCVLNDGLFGVNVLNKKIEEHMHKKKIIEYIYINKEFWYVGKPIIITKNNLHLNLFNGNVGITNINKNGVLQVSFLKENDFVHSVPITILKHYKTSWSMTVHKAQGSEFNNTALILPNIHSSYLNKDIIYTGVTRSKNNLSIFAKKDIFIKSILNKKKYTINNFNHEHFYKM